MSHRTPKKPAGWIRQLRPSDQPRFRDHLMRLDPESRWDRFNGITNETFITDYVDRSFHDGTTVIAYVEGQDVMGAAELHEPARRFDAARRAEQHRIDQREDRRVRADADGDEQHRRE